MGDAVIPVQQQQSSAEINPHSLFDAIAFIEQQYSNELGGAETSGDLFTYKQKWEFWEVGFKTSLKSGLGLVLLTPVMLGVLLHKIPIFGSNDPTVFDKFFVLALSCGFSLLFALFVAQGTSRWYGGYTRAMVKSLINGVTIGSSGKAVLVFLLFHFIYIAFLGDASLLSIGINIQKLGVSADKVASIILWVMDFRLIFVKSAYLIIGITALSLSIPWGAYLFRGTKIRASIDRGAYQGNKKFAESFLAESWPWKTLVRLANKAGCNWAQD